MRVLAVPIAATVLMITLLAVGGCAGGGNREHQTALEIRDKYLNVDTIALSAHVTADYGGRVYEFALDYSGDGARGTITVSAPENIAGVTATIDGDNVILSGGGAIVDTGAIAEDITPLTVLPKILAAWRSAYISAAFREVYRNTTAIAVEYNLGERDTTLKTWFDADSFEPLCSEVYTRGIRVLTVRFDVPQPGG